MNSIQELAQWVIDNRYPKSAKEKTSDLEMFYTIVDTFAELTKEKEPCDVSGQVCVHCGKGREMHTVVSAMCLDRFKHFEQTLR